MRDAHLLPRIRRGERDTNGVANSLAQEDPHADGAANAAGLDRTRFGDTEVDRVRPRDRELAVGEDVRPHVGRLERDLDEPWAVVQLFEYLAVAERHLDHAVRSALAVVAVDVVLLAQALVDLLGQRTGVDPDPKRDLPFLRRGDDLDHLVTVRDVAGVEAQAVDARLDRHEGEGVVVVDVGDDRQRRALDDVPQRQGSLAIGHRRAHDLAARLLQLVDLSQRRLDVAGVGLGHRLHGDGRGSPDDDAPNVDRD